MWLRNIIMICTYIISKEMIQLTPHRYDLLVKFLRFLSVPTLLASCYHVKSSLNFIEAHAEMNQLLASVHGSRNFASLFVLADFTLIFLLGLSLLFKTRLLRLQYLTDRQNFFFKIVIFGNASLCLAYLIFTGWAVLNEELSEEDFTKGLLKGMAVYPGGGLKPVIDRIQIKYKCCGTDGFTDWFNFYWYNKRVGHPDDNNDDVPFSCCSDALASPCIHVDLKDKIKYVGYYSVSNATIWQDGCLIKFKTVYKNDYTLLIILSSVIACFHLLLDFGDRLVQTADDCFAVENRFQAWLFGSGPVLEKMFLKMQAKNNEGYSIEVSKQSVHDRTVAHYSSTSGSRYEKNLSVDDEDSWLSASRRNLLKRKSEEEIEFSKKKVKHKS